MIPVLLLSLLAQAASPQGGPAAAPADVDAALAAPAAPANKQDEAPPPKIEAIPESSPGLIDFDWLEMDVRAGVAIFSDIYHIDPSPRLGLELRAPLTVFAPSDNPEGDYLGIFTQLDVTMITRTIKPEVDKPSGGMISLSVGLDYSIFRNATWLLMVRGGVQYATYGGVTDLNDGIAPMAGLRVGVTISRALSFTFTPEYVQGEDDNIMSGLAGLTFDF